MSVDSVRVSAQVEWFDNSSFVDAFLDFELFEFYYV